MPVFNEENTVKKAITNILSQSFVHQLIIINDASTDKSLQIIQSIKHPKIIVINHRENLGKGAAVHSGLARVSGDHIIINDADLEYDPRDIQKLIEPINQKKAEVVYGSRFKGPHTNMFFWHYAGNKFLNFLLNILFNTTLSDLESCYKLIPTKLAKACELHSKDFGFEPEITCQILKKNIRIYEVPISYSGRGYEEGKKLYWTQGIKAAGIIINQRLV